MNSNVHVVQLLFKLTQYLVLAKTKPPPPPPPPRPFFFRLASNAFPDIGSVGWII